MPPLHDAPLRRSLFTPPFTPAGTATGATLHLRLVYANFDAWRRDSAAHRGALAAALEQRPALQATFTAAAARMAAERKLLAEEMRLDFQQQSVVQAARVMQSMRGDLIEFVEGEEALCTEEEARASRPEHTRLILHAPQHLT